MKTICVVTGSRAEYGILKPLLEQLQADDSLSLKLVVTGMHLAYEYGLTYKQIEADGFVIDQKVEVNLSSDTAIGICKAMGLGLISFGEVYERIGPDMVIVLGDRYEIFAAVSGAYISKIPVAHIHGGEVTEGAFDDSLRHCITKMSYLHFTSTEAYRERVMQLGEAPDRVYNVGALGIEQLRKEKQLSKEKLEEQLHLQLNRPIALVTYHPTTLGESAAVEMRAVLEGLSPLSNYQIIFTKANSDTGGRAINHIIDTYVRDNANHAAAFTSLGSSIYLSLMRMSQLVIGNSSSGIIEAPSLCVPTLNIGDRQKGRIRGASVRDVPADAQMIQQALEHMMCARYRWNDIANPYEKSDTSKTIIKEIKQILDRPITLQKHFYTK